MAKQLVINDDASEGIPAIVATADSISQASDTQADWYDCNLSQNVQKVVLEGGWASDMVIAVVGQANSGKYFTMFGLPFNTQLCDFDYGTGNFDEEQLKLIED